MISTCDTEKKNSKPEKETKHKKTYSKDDAISLYYKSKLKLTKNKN